MPGVISRERPDSPDARVLIEELEAVQLFGKEYGELKRMYVRPRHRGLGLSKQMLDHLAGYALGKGVSLLRLETGIHQHAAIGLYERMGFKLVPPFGDYRVDPLSRCYEKELGEA